ncbi:unnamed protein product [Blepharisma stoltei]|uniref:Uncharacterized protein n=1 Tax=Blepharisma stoltei TaxID=1481888 RepID=A0AAU9JP85_9CILI|nr:unnamed protein product [Blepharisma stoltei]
MTDMGLLEKAEIELLDSSIEDIEDSFKEVRDLIALKSEEIDILALLQSYSLQGDHKKLSKGLVYGILIGMDWLKYLLPTSRDNFQTACITLTQLIPYLKFSQRAIWLFTQLWKLDSPAFADMFLSFIRTFDLINEIKPELDWISNQPLISLIFYKILHQASLLANDGSPILFDYVQVLSQIWRRRKDACYAIGRDLIRIISSLAEVNGIEHIWNDLFAPGRDGNPLYWTLLMTPTHPKFHSMLLLPSIEARLIYIIENANQTNFTRYLKWILDEHDECIMPDLARFIVNFPANHEGIPRWQLIEWLLASAKDHHTQASIKQSLSFDCLFFNPLQDQLYSIEPMMSLIGFSLTRYQSVSLAEELLEFMLTSAEMYDKRSTKKVLRNLKECFNVAYTQGIFPSLEMLSSDERIDSLIRSRTTDLNENYMNGIEPVLSPLCEIEEKINNEPREVMNSLGALGTQFANEPTFEILCEVLEKQSQVTEDLANYILKCLTNELLQPLSKEIQKNSILSQIFSQISQSQKMRELTKYLNSAEPAVGIRLVIYSLQTNSTLYLQFDSQLERDLKICLHDSNQEILSWIFPLVFENFPSIITPNIIHLYIQNSEIHTIYRTELDLSLKKYTIFSDNYVQILEKSKEFSSIEQAILWKLIQAEFKPEMISKILEYLKSSISACEQWESLSGLLTYLCTHISYLNDEHIKLLLQLPAKVFKVTVYIVFSKLPGNLIKENILEGLRRFQFHSQINLFKHLKHWTEQKGKLKDILKEKSIQEMLIQTLQSFASDYFKEFNCLLESGKQLYTL